MTALATALVTAAAPAVVTGLVNARITYQVSGAPLYRTPTGRLIAPTDLTVRVIDGQAELDLVGVQIDPRTLDPAQPEHRIDARVPIALAPRLGDRADRRRPGRAPCLRPPRARP